MKKYFAILVAIFAVLVVGNASVFAETYRQKMERLNEREAALDRREVALDQLSKHLNNWYASENERSRQNDEERARIKAERAAIEAERRQMYVSAPPAGEFVPAQPPAYAAPVPVPAPVPERTRTYYYYDDAYSGYVAWVFPWWWVPPVGNLWLSVLPVGYAPIGWVHTRTVNNIVTVNNVTVVNNRGIRHHDFDRHMRGRFRDMHADKRFNFERPSHTRIDGPRGHEPNKGPHTRTWQQSHPPRPMNAPAPRNQSQARPAPIPAPQPQFHNVRPRSMPAPSPGVMGPATKAAPFAPPRSHPQGRGRH